MKSMLKHKFLLFILCSLFSFGQQNNPIIKIYLKDDITGKNIKNARVTLEGFEIPPIEGNYDKKGKYYYFTEIPKGYNTVMAYHKKYNEKGFQDKEELPKELYLNLCRPKDVTITTYMPDDLYKYSGFSKKYSKFCYVEDPYKVAVSIYSFKSCKCIDSIIGLKSIDVEIVHVSASRKPIYTKEFNCDDLPESYLLTYELGRLKFKPAVYVLLDFVETCDYGGNTFLFLRKKDGSKFKRFNDPLLKELRMNGVVVEAISYFRYAHTKNIPYKSRYARQKAEVRQLDSNFSKIKDSDKSRLLLYGVRSMELRPVSDNIEAGYGININDLDILKYNDLGLGIFDQYDYFIKKYGKIPVIKL